MKCSRETVTATVKASAYGMTYEALKDKIDPSDLAEFDRAIVAAMKQGGITIRNGRYVARHTEGEQEK